MPRRVSLPGKEPKPKRTQKRSGAASPTRSAAKGTEPKNRPAIKRARALKNAPKKYLAEDTLTFHETLPQPTQHEFVDAYAKFVDDIEERPIIAAYPAPMPEEPEEHVPFLDTRFGFSSVLFVLVLIGGFLMSSVDAATYQSPTQAPPGGNIPQSVWNSQASGQKQAGASLDIDGTATIGSDALDLGAAAGGQNVLYGAASYAGMNALDYLMLLQTYSGVSFTSRFSLDKNGDAILPGRISIGSTSAPTNKLVVKESVGNTAGLVVQTVGGSYASGITLGDINNGSRYLGIGHDGNGFTIAGANAGASGLRIMGASSLLQMFTDTTNPIEFFTDNAERMRIAGTGKIGVGETAPTAFLEVKGDGSIEELRLNRNALAATNGLLSLARQGSVHGYVGLNASDQVIITDGATAAYTFSTVNSTANSKLTVNGGVVSSSGLTTYASDAPLSGTIQTSKLCLGDASTGNEAYCKTAWTIQDGTAAGQTLRWDGTQWAANTLLYNNGTSVGIGTSSPGAQLSVSKDSANGIVNTLVQVSGQTLAPTISGSGLVQSFITNGGSTWGAVGGYSNGARGIGLWSAGNTGAPQLYIDSTGKLGVGTASPQQAFHVASSAAQAYIELQGANGITYFGNDNLGNASFQSGTAGKDIKFYNSAGGSPLAVITNGGNLGVGDSSPLATLTIGNGDLFQVAGATGNTQTAGTLKVSKHSAFGADSNVDDGSLLYSGYTYSSIDSLQERITTVTPNYVEGITDYVQLDPTAGAAYLAYGIDAEIETKAGNAQSVPVVTGGYFLASKNGTGAITGGLLGADAIVTNGAAGNVASAYALHGIVANYDTGSITDAAGLWVSTALNLGLGTVTNNYGVYIEDQSGVGSTKALNLYSAGASSSNVLDGSLTVNGNQTLGDAITDTATVNGMLRVGLKASTEPGGTNGNIYYNTTNNKFRCFENGTWTNCSGLDPQAGTLAGQTLRWDGSQWAASSLLFNSSTAVGINTSSPGAKLEVFGAGYNDSILVNSNNAFGSGISFKNTALGGHQYSVFASGPSAGIGTGGFGIFDDTSSGYRFIINASGNVGISDNAPATTFTVGAGSPFQVASNGNMTTSGNVVSNGNQTFGDAATDRATITGELRIGQIASDPTGTNGLVYYNTTSNKFRCFENGTWANCNGRDPQVGTLAGQTLRWDGSLWVASSLLFNDGTNVGIGTTGPSTKLQISDATIITTFTGNQLQGLRVQGGDNVLGNQYSLLGFSSTQSPWNGSNLAQIGAKFAPAGSYLQFGTSSNYASGITNTAATIDPSGFVGIGTTAPTNRVTIAPTDGTTGLMVASPSVSIGANTAIELGYNAGTAGYGNGRIRNSTIAGGASSLIIEASSAANTFNTSQLVLNTDGSITAAGDLAVNGDDLTTSSGTFNLLNSGATDINIGGAATTVAIGGGGTSTLQVRGQNLTTNQTTFNLVNTTATTVNFGGAATTMNIGPGGATAASINLGGGFGATGCTVAGATGGLSCDGDVTIKTGASIDLSAASGQVYLFNNNASNVDFAEQASTLTMGGSGSLTSINGSTITYGKNISTQSSGTVAGAEVRGTFSKNNATLATFPVVKIDPQLAFGVSNSATTVNILDIDTGNGGTTGVTTNLIKASYGGTQKFLLSSNGDITFGGVTKSGWPALQNNTTTNTYSSGAGTGWKIVTCPAGYILTGGAAYGCDPVTGNAVAGCLASYYYSATQFEVYYSDEGQTATVTAICGRTN